MKAFLIELGIISLLIAAVIGLLALFSNKMKDRLSASCRYIIWLIVIARLAVPFGGVLVPSLINIPVDNAQIEEKAPVDVAPENEGYVESGQIQNSIGSSNIDTGDNMQSGAVDSSDSQPSAPQFTPEKEPTYSGALEAETDNKGFELNSDMIAPVLFVIWAAGAVIFFTVNVIRYNGIKEAMRRNLTEADGRVAELYEELCREMEIKKAPALYSSPLAQSPMLCGYFKKKIIVPRLSVSESSLRAVLTHELTHHKRGDVWAKLLALIANSIHWFNPAVYAAVERFNSEMELSCDEKTLLGKDDETRVEYGRTMLDIVSRCRGGDAVLTTKFNPKKNASGERINNILDTRKKGKGIIVIAATVLTCLIVGVIIGCEVVKADPAGNSGTAGTDPETTDQDTTAPEKTDDTTTAQPDETTGEEALAINTDILDEYMMTYGELAKKYGELIDYESIMGNGSYLFENGFGYYAFNLNKNNIEILTDTEDDFKYPKIDDTEVCKGIFYLSAETIFNKSFDALSIEAIAAIDGINYVETISHAFPDHTHVGHYNPIEAYASSFKVDNDNNSDLYLVLYHKDKNLIDSTSECSIFIRDIVIDNENKEQDPRHSILYTFDENNNKIYGVYKGNLIERLILEVKTWTWYSEDARVFSNGKEVFEGELQKGMKVKIYRLGVFYGEYEIAELLEPYPQP